MFALLGHLDYCCCVTGQHCCGSMEVKSARGNDCCYARSVTFQWSTLDEVLLKRCVHYSVVWEFCLLFRLESVFLLLIALSLVLFAVLVFVASVLGESCGSHNNFTEIIGV